MRVANLEADFPGKTKQGNGRGGALSYLRFSDKE